MCILHMSFQTLFQTNKPTRLQVFVTPYDASDKSVVYTSDVGTIKDVEIEMPMEVIVKE